MTLNFYGCFLLLFSCHKAVKEKSKEVTSVDVETLLNGSTGKLSWLFCLPVWGFKSSPLLGTQVSSSAALWQWPVERKKQRQPTGAHDTMKHRRSFAIDVRGSISSFYPEKEKKRKEKESQSKSVSVLASFWVFLTVCWMYSLDFAPFKRIVKGEQYLPVWSSHDSAAQ